MEAERAELLKLISAHAGGTQENGSTEKPLQADPRFIARLEAMEKQNAQLRETVTKILLKEKEDRRKVVIDGALKLGKILPKDRKFWEERFDKDPDGIAQILEKTPAMNPSLFTVKGTGQDGTAFEFTETSEDKKVRENLGLSPEDYRQFADPDIGNGF